MQEDINIGASAVEERWRFTAPLAVLVAIGAMARLALINQVMRNDEVVTFIRYAADFGTALTDYFSPNNHILHSVLVRVATSILGESPWAARVPSLLAGLGLIVAVNWWIGCAANQNAALLASALVAGSSVLIESSTTARGYSMIALAMVLLIEISRRLLIRDSLRLWTVWVLVSALGFLTIPVFAFPFVTICTWLTLNFVFGRGRDRRSGISSLIVATLMVGVLTAVFYIPAAVNSGIDTILDNDFVQPLAWDELPAQWSIVVGRLGKLAARDLASMYLLFGGVAVVFNRRIFGNHLSPILGVIGAMLLAVARQVAPPERVWFFLWPLGLGLVGAGLGFALERVVPRLASRRWLVAGLAFTIAVAMSVSTVASGEVPASREGGAFSDAPAVAAYFVEELADSDRVVIVSHPSIVLDFYLSERGWSGPQLSLRYRDAERLFIVVYHPRPQTLESVLLKARVPTQDFTIPTLVRAFPNTDIYVSERLGH